MAAEAIYHRSVLALLGVDHVLSPSRADDIAARERACGVRFPAAVREWFAVPDAETLFHENTNTDLLEPVGELGDPAETRQGWLKVATENQAVVAWYVRLDEGDDPPVYDNNDEWNVDLSTTHWRANANTFSTFMFDMLATLRLGGWYTGLRLTARDWLPDAATLCRLRAWFQEGPTTVTPTARGYRFFTPDGLVTIWSSTPADLAAGVAEWGIGTRSEAALFEFGRRLWNVGNLAATLRPDNAASDRGKPGEMVLKRLRTELPSEHGSTPVTTTRYCD